MRLTRIGIISLIAITTLASLVLTFALHGAPSTASSAGPSLRIDFAGNHVAPPSQTPIPAGTAGPSLRIDFQGIHPAPQTQQAAPVGAPAPAARIDFAGHQAEVGTR
jgi:hypothetical protein